jgi:hypothetical protein
MDRCVLVAGGTLVWPLYPNNEDDTKDLAIRLNDLRGAFR